MLPTHQDIRVKRKRFIDVSYTRWKFIEDFTRYNPGF